MGARMPFPSEQGPHVQPLARNCVQYRFDHSTLFAAHITRFAVVRVQAEQPLCAANKPKLRSNPSAHAQRTRARRV